MGEFLGDGKITQVGLDFWSQVYDINNCKVVGVMAKIGKGTAGAAEERCSFCTFF
jgi:hypothetical protein